MARSLLNKTTRVGDVFPVAGAPYHATSAQLVDSLKLGGKAAKVYQTTVSDPGDDTDITISIGPDLANLTDVTTNTGTGNDAAAIAALIADEINATSGASNLVYATSSGTTLIITGRQPGEEFVVSESDSSLSTPSVTTSAADATPVPFGVLIERSLADRVDGSNRPIAKAVGSGTYAAKVMTLDASGISPAVAANDVLTCRVFIDADGLGEREYSASAVFDTNIGTTITDLVALLEAELPANTVSATVADTDTLTLTGEIAGLDFRAELRHEDDSLGSTISIAFTTGTANALPDFGGIALQNKSVEQDADGVTKYRDGHDVSAGREGIWWVLVDDGASVALGDAVFFRVTASSDKQVGAFRTDADSGNCLPLSAAGFTGEWLTANQTDMDGNNVAALRLR